MTAQQLKDLEREAREILTGAASLERKFMRLLAQARGERPARLSCTRGSCLRARAFRAAGILAAVIDLYAAHKFGAF